MIGIATENKKNHFSPGGPYKKQVYINIANWILRKV